jgi:hypothetical protein
MIMIFTEVMTTYGDGCVVAGAGTTFWSDPCFKVCASGMAIGRNLALAIFGTRRSVIVRFVAEFFDGEVAVNSLLEQGRRIMTFSRSRIRCPHSHKPGW